MRVAMTWVKMTVKMTGILTMRRRRTLRMTREARELRKHQRAQVRTAQEELGLGRTLFHVVQNLGEDILLACFAKMPTNCLLGAIFHFEFHSGNFLLTYTLELTADRTVGIV